MNLQSIVVADCQQSTTNIQGRTAGKAFNELVESVKSKGVLVPVLARALKGGRFEVIAGNRRLAAAIIAKHENIPAHVVVMNDTEAREAQIVENLQREDIHPLDEGKLYRKLIEEAKYDTISISAKVGKPEPYVKQRLFLTNLELKPAEAYRSGKILDGHAVLIARLSAGDQLKALVEATRWGITVKDLKEWIEEQIYSPLEKQPWLKSPEAPVGKCVECKPNRMSLFGDVKEGACTDLKCWSRKLAAYVAWRGKAGKLVRVSDEYGDVAKGVLSKSKFIQVPKSGKNRCKFAQGAIVVEGGDICAEFDVCINEKCPTHRRLRSEYGNITPEEQEKRQEERKKEIEKAKKDKADLLVRLNKALKKVKWPLDEKQFEALMELVFETIGVSVWRSIAKRHVFEVKKIKQEWGGDTYQYDVAVKAAAKSMNKTEKLSLVFEMLADTGYEGLRGGIDLL
jgi:ParB family chromosome partitioning protein